MQIFSFCFLFSFFLLCFETQINGKNQLIKRKFTKFTEKKNWALDQSHHGDIKIHQTKPCDVMIQMILKTIMLALIFQTKLIPKIFIDETIGLKKSRIASLYFIINRRLVTNPSNSLYHMCGDYIISCTFMISLQFNEP